MILPTTPVVELVHAATAWPTSLVLFRVPGSRQYKDFPVSTFSWKEFPLSGISWQIIQQ
jgi:hypothetical protein